MSQRYTSLGHPDLKDALHLHNYTIFRLAVLVSEFAQQMAAAHELFSKEIQSVISAFRRRSYELKKERPVDTPCTIFTAWETLLQETEMDAQAHMDAAGLLIKNVYRPLQEVATHKSSHTQQLIAFRDILEKLVEQCEAGLGKVERDYQEALQALAEGGDDEDSQEASRSKVMNYHNDYVLSVRSANRTVEQFRSTLPEVLEEMEEIYIDASNTINVAIEGHALLMLTKATEQHRRFENQLKICRQVNPQLDVSYFVSTVNPDNVPFPKLPLHHFHVTLPPGAEQLEAVLRNQLITDECTAKLLQDRRVSLQRKGMELASAIKHSQDKINSHINVCQRNLAKHQYAKVYETQQDMCRKRNEMRMANMQLAAIKAQMEMLSQKQNGSVGSGLGEEGADQEQEDKKEHTATIKGLWKKAFKSLKKSDQNWLAKKGASLKLKDSKAEEEVEPEEPKEIDPVYSLLKCAADLPKVSRSQCKDGGPCSSHRDSSGSTSKASSPSSSASHSPKTRRKKLNARMKSFSLDTPDPPKQLLSIDETTKKKSSSFTNTCFGASGSTSPSEPISMPPPASKKRFGWAMRSSSLEIEDSRKLRSHSASPSGSPKSKKKDMDSYIVLYHFRGKEKDDMDLRAGTRIQVSNSSDPDWWKGKYNGRSGYFPAKYVLRIEPGQHIYQVLRTINLTETDGLSGIRLHKDQIVFQVNPECGGMIHVRSASNRECFCPSHFLVEV